METVDKLLGALHQAEAQALARYFETVKTLAIGGNVSPEELRATLDAARRSPADLRRDVALSVRRNDWRAMHGRLPELEQALLEVQGQIKDVDAALEAAIERHRKAHDELVPRREHLRRQIFEARDAGRALVSEFIAGDPLATELQAVRGELEKATAKVADLRAATAAAEAQARSAKSEVARSTRGAYWREVAAREERRAAELRASLAEVERLVVQLERRVEELERRALEV